MGSYVIILIAVFGLMWLLLIRPQRKRQLQQSRMQDAIEPGDDVLDLLGSRIRAHHDQKLWRSRHGHGDQSRCAFSHPERSDGSN